MPLCGFQSVDGLSVSERSCQEENDLLKPFAVASFLPISRYVGRLSRVVAFNFEKLKAGDFAI